MCTELILAIVYFTIIFVVNIFLYKLLQNVTLFQEQAGWDDATRRHALLLPKSELKISQSAIKCAN